MILLLLLLLSSPSSPFQKVEFDRPGQLTLTLKMTTAQVVETSVTVNNNSPIEDYIHPDDQTQPFEMTPGFKPFTDLHVPTN